MSLAHVHLSDPAVVNALGVTGALISMAMMMPQASKVWLARRDPGSLAGLSAATYAMMATNSLIWVVYAVGTKAWWSGVSSLVNGPLAVMMTFLLVRALRSPQDVVDPADGLDDAPVAHGAR